MVSVCGSIHSGSITFEPSLVLLLLLAGQRADWLTVTRWGRLWGGQRRSVKGRISLNGTVHMLLFFAWRHHAPSLGWWAGWRGREGLERRDGAGGGKSPMWGGRCSSILHLAGWGDKAGQLSVAVSGVEPVLLQGGLRHGRKRWQPWMALMSGSGGLTSWTRRILKHYLVIELGVLCYPCTWKHRGYKDGVSRLLFYSF